jgi:hypothetical protein
MFEQGEPPPRSQARPQDLRRRPGACDSQSAKLLTPESAKRLRS